MEDLNPLSLPELYDRLVAGKPLDRLIELALEEDLGLAGDITSRSIIPEDRTARAALVSRESGVVAGLPIVSTVFLRLGQEGVFTTELNDGDSIEAREVLGTLDAPLRAMLKAERLVLNLLSRLSGIATLTRQYVQAVAGTGVQICDTRKTTPGLRRLEKYATRCGGATLHRIGLFDAALYKDNHLSHVSSEALKQSLKEAVERVRQKHKVRFVEVEVDTLEQLSQVLEVGPELIDFVLLDNMPRDVLRQAVRMRSERAPEIKLEASGGITLSNVRSIAETGVDRISVGALTHSSVALDIGLDIEPAQERGS